MEIVALGDPFLLVMNFLGKCMKLNYEFIQYLRSIETI